MTLPGWRPTLLGLLAAGLVAGAIAWGSTALRMPFSRPTSQAVDLVPLWCSARLLRGEAWRCTPEVLETVFHRRLPPRPTDDHSYVYPPTTALLLLPTTALPFDTVARGFRVVSVAGVVGSALLAALGARPRSAALSLGLGALLGAWSLHLRVTGGCLVAGQSGPVLVGLTTLGLYTLARGWGAVAGGVAALGAAFKLLPGLLLLAAARRRPFLLAFLGLLGGLGALALAAHGGPAGLPSYAHLADIVNPPPRDAWLHNEPPWVLSLWRARVGLLGIPSLAIAFWSAWRPRPAADAATAAVLVAWAGTVMAGSQQAHEAIVVLPAVAWALAWPLQRGPVLLPLAAALLLAGGLAWSGVASRFQPPHNLSWVVAGTLTWIVLVVRWAAERRADSARARPHPKGARSGRPALVLFGGEGSASPLPPPAAPPPPTPSGVGCSTTLGIRAPRPDSRG